MSIPFPQSLPPHSALLIVDLQNDFLPGGALGVSGGNGAAFACARYAGLFTAQNRPVFLSRDWHPKNHCSFTAQGGIWPPHCVAGTPGAAFASVLPIPDNAQIVSKATAQDKDAYSAFEGTLASGATLDAALKQQDIQTLFIGGLATDYCVKATALDARRLGYRVAILQDAVAAVDVEPGDGKRALEEMQAAGCELIV
jgi:nicotinamidase/pyrazinamidase